MTNPITPSRYQSSVIAHIMLNDAAAAIDFYKQAFDATELFRITNPDKKIIHAEISINGSVIMVGDSATPFSNPLELSGTTTGLHAYVKDVDKLFEQATHAGAKSLQPVQDMFYGDRVGMLRDPFGHVWVLLTHLEDLTSDQIKQRGEALFKK